MTARIRSLEELPAPLREQARAQLKAGVSATPPKRSRYGIEAVESDGERYGSKWELRRHLELIEQQSAGLISEVRHTVPFPLHVVTPTGDRERIASFEADFTYRRAGALVVEDTKCEATRRKELYQHKAKHFEAEYGLRIIEIVRARRRKPLEIT